MLKGIIDFSLKNRFFVLIATLGLVAGGVFALRNIPLDAIPDLSDTQVIIYTEWQGQAPQIIQDQVTYPITSKMLSVPGQKRCAVIPSTATRWFTSFSTTALIHTGREAVFLSISAPLDRACPRTSPYAWTGRDRSRMGLHVFNQLQGARLGPTALDSRLVSKIPTDLCAGRGGSRLGRRICQTISNHGRSRPFARLQPFHIRHRRRSAAEQWRSGRALDGNGGKRVHFTGQRLHSKPRRY